MDLDESELRQAARNWLERRHHENRYIQKPLVLHDTGLSVTGFLKNNYKGDLLRRIPKYNDMHVKPDIIAILRTKHDTFALMTAECKIDPVNTGDLRQAIDYASVCCSYEAFFVFQGPLNQVVKDRIRSGNSVYLGYNESGRLSKRILMLIQRKDAVFFPVRV